MKTWGFERHQREVKPPPDKSSTGLAPIVVLTLGLQIPLITNHPSVAFYETHSDHILSARTTKLMKEMNDGER